MWLYEAVEEISSVWMSAYFVVEEGKDPIDCDRLYVVVGST